MNRNVADQEGIKVSSRRQTEETLSKCMQLGAECHTSSNKSMAEKRHRRRKNGEGSTTELPDFCDFLCLLVARKTVTEFLKPL
jgi:hypothetical protein